MDLAAGGGEAQGEGDSRTEPFVCSGRRRPMLAADNAFTPTLASPPAGSSTFDRPEHLRSNMTDRTEALLAELVELQRRQVKNQEHALERQEYAISVQQVAVARQQSALRRAWVLIGLIALIIVGMPVITWVVRPGR